MSSLAFICLPYLSGLLCIEDLLCKILKAQTQCVKNMPINGVMMMMMSPRLNTSTLLVFGLVFVPRTWNHT